MLTLPGMGDSARDMGLPPRPVALLSWDGHGRAGIKPADTHPPTWHAGGRSSPWEKGGCPLGMSP